MHIGIHCMLQYILYTASAGTPGRVHQADCDCSAYSPQLTNVAVDNYSNAFCTLILTTKMGTAALEKHLKLHSCQ